MSENWLLIVLFDGVGPMHRFGHGEGYGGKSRLAVRRNDNSDGRRVGLRYRRPYSTRSSRRDATGSD